MKFYKIGISWVFIRGYKPLRSSYRDFCRRDDNGISKILKEVREALRKPQ